ncbi:ABC1 kinase family protein [Paludisphaera mucosa]|uniref:AarF/ABC1/UbiB kinase family protein n=1 Tax=Paludisphaera mucosa TaxID=3030827 RepID=A0ABT6F5U0_9BACT|nr:AarF/ABC1/UbiB kinase family protein [Paludisphaera mucosa]MDG3002779.1 AarF/ABC1/UbiB kinase family protein [Paludisphaera mucosa]
MIRETVGHLRDLPRYRQILTTLARYGYQDVVAALRLETIVRPLERVALGEEVAQLDRPRRLRLICEELGPTFVKLGQLLSTRPDLLPESYTNELAALRDDVRPFPSEQAEAILVEEYGRPLAACFASIDPTPVASASISQVHRAVLHDGRTVALKVRRPDLHKVVAADLDILKNLAQLAERRLPALAVYRPLALVREFERTIKRELDFSIELRTIKRCQAQFAGDATAHIPFVVEEFSTPRVLAMEFIGGVRVDDVAAIRGLGLDPGEVAVAGARILIKQIFQFGFFHADPHSGNLRVLGDGVVAPLDYGMFGQLDPRTRERIADLLIGLLAQDVDGVLKALDELEVRGEAVDARELRRDVGELVQSYCDLTLATIDLGVLLRELVGLIRRHRLLIPPDLVLLIRSLVTIESTGRALDPKFDIARQLEPILRKLALRRYSPRRLMTQAASTAKDVQRIATLLPDLLSHSLESIKRGELNVKFDLQGFERLVRQLTRASNTLAVGIVIAGLLVASSLIFRGGASSLAQLGYGLGMALSLWLIWNMSRNS